MIRIIKNIFNENRTLLLLLLLFVFYVIYKKSNDRIIYLDINYLFIGVFLFSVVFVYFVIRKFKWLSDCALIELSLITIFCGYVMTVCLFFPINSYNIKYSLSKNTAIYVDCPIINISKRRMSRGMTISFHQEKIFIRGYRSIFNKLETKGENIGDYVVKVKYKLGLFNSIILINSDVVRK